MKPQINFYQLSTTPMEKALPRLLEKAISSGKRVILLIPEAEKMEEYNKLLWSYGSKSFLPHGSKNDNYKDQQPIYLTTSDEVPNEASILALISDIRPTHIDKFEKCLYLFDGESEQETKKARQRWAEYKKEGYILAYWQQDLSGKWQEKK